MRGERIVDNLLKFFSGHTDAWSYALDYESFGISEVQVYELVEDRKTAIIYFERGETRLSVRIVSWADGHTQYIDCFGHTFCTFLTSSPSMPSQIFSRIKKSRYCPPLLP